MTTGIRTCKVNASLDTCLVFCGSRGPVIAELENENGVRHELFPRAKVNCSSCDKRKFLLIKASREVRETVC